MRLFRARALTGRQYFGTSRICDFDRCFAGRSPARVLGRFVRADLRFTVVRLIDVILTRRDTRRLFRADAFIEIDDPRHAFPIGLFASARIRRGLGAR